MHVCIFVCVSASKLSLRFISFNYLKIGKMEQCEGRKRIFTGVGGGLSRGSRVRRAGSEDPPHRQQKLLSQSKIERAYFSSNSSNTHPLPQRCKSIRTCKNVGTFMVSQKILEQYHELAHKYDRLHIFCVSTFAIDNLLILNLSMNIDSAIMVFCLVSHSIFCLSIFKIHNRSYTNKSC